MLDIDSEPYKALLGKIIEVIVLERHVDKLEALYYDVFNRK